MKIKSLVAAAATVFVMAGTAMAQSIPDNGFIQGQVTGLSSGPSCMTVHVGAVTIKAPNGTAFDGLRTVLANFAGDGQVHTLGLGVVNPTPCMNPGNGNGTTVYQAFSAE